jgi:hypothetical protein
MAGMIPTIRKAKMRESLLLAGALLGLGLSNGAEAQTRYPYSEWARRFHYADSVSDFADKQPKLHDMLLRLIKPMESGAGLKEWEAGSTQDTLKTSTKAWLSGEHPPKQEPQIGQDTLDTLRILAKNELKSALESAGMTDDRIDSLLAPVESNYREALKIAKAKNLRIVDRYLQKFGPGAPQLNLLETFAASVLQHAGPPFGPGENGTGPLEMVAGYSTTYFLAYQYRGPSIPKQLTVGSLLQWGIRWYQFDPWGQSKFWRLMTPSYLTLGAAWGGKEDWFLLWPRDNDFNPGGFLEISGVQLAVIPGDNTKVYLGRRFQVVPYFF